MTMFAGDMITYSKSVSNQAIVREVPTNGLQEEKSGLLVATEGGGCAGLKQEVAEWGGEGGGPEDRRLGTLERKVKFVEN